MIRMFQPRHALLRAGVLLSVPLGLIGQAAPQPGSKPCPKKWMDLSATEQRDTLFKALDVADREYEEDTRDEARSMALARADQVLAKAVTTTTTTSTSTYPSPVFSLGFTGHEQTDPSGLIYMQQRFYVPWYGAFTRPDPKRDQHPLDPQSWNLYSYVRNNPTMRIDPTGEAVQLSNDDKIRKRQLSAARQAVGEKAGKYLYDNAVQTKGADGKMTTSHFIGIYSNGPDGKGQAFGSLNKTASAFGDVINDKRVAVMDLVPHGTKVHDYALGLDAVIGKSPNLSPGVTITGADGRQHVTLLDQANLGFLPGNRMSNSRPGYIDDGTLTAHEFGHLHGSWFPGIMNRIFGTDRPGATDDKALELENDVRTRRHPDGPTRTDH